MNLVKFETRDADAYVNPDQIAAIQDYDGGPRILLAGGHYINAKENLADIFDKLAKTGSVVYEKVEPAVRSLKDFEPGSLVRIGDNIWNILNHNKEDGTTEMVSYTKASEMPFGETAEYRSSNVRSYCENTFYSKLTDLVGAKNIKQHYVDLTALDGTGDGEGCSAKVSVLTASAINKYEKQLMIPCYSFWTATRKSYNSEDKRYVLLSSFISTTCDQKKDVYPYVVLDSNVTAQKAEFYDAIN